MFKSIRANRREISRKHVPSIISGDLDILGNLISDGTVDIEGRIQGNVKASRILIRKDGRVLGDVQADEVHIYGQVRGLVKAKDVHLYATCKVEGTIMHELLSIEDGAFVDGKFKRTDKTPIERAREVTEEAEEVVAEETAPINLLQNLRLITNKE